MRVTDIQATDDSLGTFDQATFSFNVMSRLRVQLAMLNQQQAQLFNRGEQLVANLFLEYFTKEPPKRTHVEPQRRLLQLAILTGELREPRALLIHIPKPMHTLYSTRTIDWGGHGGPPLQSFGCPNYAFTSRP